MPMPLWFGHVSKRLFNKSEIKKGIRPVLTHNRRVYNIFILTQGQNRFRSNGLERVTLLCAK